MKFLNSEKVHFAEKKDIQKSKNAHKVQKSNIIYANFQGLTNYNRCRQSINGSSIEILIKINLEKAFKLNSLAIF